MKIDIDIKGHMPYFVKLNGKSYLFYCIGRKEKEVFGESTYEYCAWTIVYVDLDEPQKVMRISTGFDKKDIECNPSCHVDGDEVVISFSAARIQKDQPAMYSLYEMRGESLDSLSLPVKINTTKSLFNGFTSKDLLVYTAKAPQNALYVRSKDGQKKTIKISGIDEILRAVPVDKNSSKLIITGRIKDQYFSFLFDIDTKKILGKIQIYTESGLKDVYKCCTYGDYLIYAERGQDFEDRCLKTAKYVVSEDQDVEDLFKIEDVFEDVDEQQKVLYKALHTPGPDLSGASIKDKNQNTKNLPDIKDFPVKNRKNGCSGCAKRKAKFKEKLLDLDREKLHKSLI